MANFLLDSTLFSADHTFLDSMHAFWYKPSAPAGGHEAGDLEIDCGIEEDQDEYAIQFAESAEHPHVHFHIVPRAADMPEERRRIHVFGYLGVPEEERVSEETMNAIADQVRLNLHKSCET